MIPEYLTKLLFQKMKYLLLLLLLVLMSSDYTSRLWSQDTEVRSFPGESENIGDMTSYACRDSYEKIAFSGGISEPERLALINQALEKMDGGDCDYCPKVVLRLIEKSDLENESLGFDKKIQSLLRKKVECAIYFLPKLINRFDMDEYKIFLLDMYKSLDYEFDTLSITVQDIRKIERKVVLGVLLSNYGYKESNSSVTNILMRFRRIESIGRHRRLLEIAIACNPSSKDILYEIIKQGLYMRNISSEFNNFDSIEPNYQAELARINNIREWSQYKIDNNINSSDFHNHDDWDANGTVAFLEGLLKNGFTVTER